MSFIFIEANPVSFSRFSKYLNSGRASDQSSHVSFQASHHDDMLGHILEDISLDEWDVIPDEPTPDAPIPNASIPDDLALDTLAHPDISPPEDEWVASEIIPMSSWRCRVFVGRRWLSTVLCATGRLIPNR